MNDTIILVLAAIIGPLVAALMWFRNRSLKQHVSNHRCVIDAQKEAQDVIQEINTNHPDDTRARVLAKTERILGRVRDTNSRRDGGD